MPELRRTLAPSTCGPSDTQGTGCRTTADSFVGHSSDAIATDSSLGRQAVGTPLPGSDASSSICGQVGTDLTQGSAQFPVLDRPMGHTGIPFSRGDDRRQPAVLHPGTGDEQPSGAGLGDVNCGRIRPHCMAQDGYASLVATSTPAPSTRMKPMCK